MNRRISIDLASGVPPYEQIRGQITALVAAGVLDEGERLPTVRDLASDLAVATGTVQRAYRELETTGVVTSRRRLGTVVAQVPGARSTHGTRALATRFVAETRTAGLGDEEILDLVRGALMSTGPEHP